MDADFLIIGGGIAGISAAARLSALGSVLLMEGEDHLAHHASGRSAAMYEPHYGAAPVVALSLASGDYFRAQDKVLSPRGMLVIAKADEGEGLARDADAMAMTLISAEQAQAMVPVLNLDVVKSAAHAAHAWDIDTDLLIQQAVLTAAPEPPSGPPQTAAPEESSPPAQRAAAAPPTAPSAPRTPPECCAPSHPSRCAQFGKERLESKSG